MIAGLSARYGDDDGDGDSSDSSLWSVCSSPRLDYSQQYSPDGNASPGLSPVHWATQLAGTDAKSSRSAADPDDDCSLPGDVTGSPSPSGEVFNSLPLNVRRGKLPRIRHTALTRALTRQSKDLSRSVEERSVKSAEIQVQLGYYY